MISSNLGVYERGKEALQQVIAAAQRSPGSQPGKAAVIGFSLGGTAALVYAAAIPEAVSVVIAYNPATRQIADLQALVERIHIPVLVFAGERDTFQGCCPTAG